MGRIKTKLIKRVTKKLMQEHPSDFKEDFRENKLLVDKSLDILSKKLRNSIAGYVTRIVKSKKDVS